MNAFVLALLFAVVIIAAASFSRRRSALAHVDEPAQLAPGQPLPSRLREPLREVCLEQTNDALGILFELGEAERLARAGDFGAAARRLERGGAQVEMLAERAMEAADTYARDDEEVGWWTGHAIECAELLLDVSREASALEDGRTGPLLARLQQAKDSGEDLLLAAHDFAIRKLDLDLEEALDAHAGPERKQQLLRAVKAAEKRASA